MKKIIFILAAFAPLMVNAQLADSNARLVHVKGAINFRDVGGYKTKDGKEVKWGKVYRSADVSKLTDTDLDTLEARNIHTVIDFRGVKESAAAPDHLLPDTDYTLSPAGSDSLPNMQDMVKRMQKGDFLIDFYTNTQYFGSRYKPLFQKLVALPEGESLMYHCTGGRDRTGMATALFLYILGVSKETIEADFVASNIYLKSMNSKMFESLKQNPEVDVDALQKAMALKPELIQAMFTAIEREYGSVEVFFNKELGIGAKEIAILRNKYTI